MNRYLIFGAGAVGTLLGGLLAQAGHSVVFVGRSNNVEHIKQEGIQIQGLWGNHQAAPQPAYESIKSIPISERDFDQIFICTKAFDTANAIDSCFPVINKFTKVIPFQNGYGNCQIVAERIGWKQTLGARVITGVELKSPGQIEVTVHADAIRIGHYLNQWGMKDLEAIVQPMQEAGIWVEATDQLEQFIWAKLLYNAALNPMGALLGVTYGNLAENDSTRQVMEQIVEEAFMVTQSHEIEHFWPGPQEYLEAFYNQMVPTTAKHFPSMLRDLERKKRTEIDAINGAIATLGQERNILTPVNDTIISLIKFRESRYLS